MDTIAKIARREGFEYIDLFVRSGNIGAIKFYMKIGYKVCKILTNHYRVDSVYEDGYEMRYYFDAFPTDDINIKIN